METSVVNRNKGSSLKEHTEETRSLHEEQDGIELQQLSGDSNDTEVDIHRLEAMETLVLTKVDKFLSTFDLKLSSMEKYLSQSASGVGSTASNTSAALKSYAPTYSKLVDTLSSIKGYLYKNQQQNLHPLKQIIDEYYEQEEEFEEEHVRELLHNEKEPKHQTRQRLLHTIQLLNARLTDFEHHHNLPPLATHPSERLIALKETLYNYDTAMTVSSHRHLTFYELPFQWRENKYIIYGYRFAKSHLSAMTSFLFWHNETVNIWTHLLGTFYLFYLAFYDFPNSEHYSKYTALPNDHLIVYLFIAAAVVCLLFSSIWHSYTNIGYLSIRSKFACFDYSGITVLITSSIITTEHC